MTLEERRAYMRKYYAEHKEKLAEYAKKYHRERRLKYNETQRNSREKNPRPSCEASRRWRAAHPNYYREYRAKNRDRINARARQLRKYDPFVNVRKSKYDKEYYLKNREKILLRGKLYRLKKLEEKAARSAC